MILTYVNLSKFTSFIIPIKFILRAKLSIFDFLHGLSRKGIFIVFLFPLENLNKSSKFHCRIPRSVRKIFSLSPFYNFQIFDRIRKINPQLLEKLKIIKGDILEEDLGIDEKDFQDLVDNVNVIFHAAASVRFGKLFS